MTGEVIATTDPGRAMITGKWKEMVASRGRYFVDSGARAPISTTASPPISTPSWISTMERFGIGVTGAGARRLVAFRGRCNRDYGARANDVASPHADLVAVRNILARFSISVDLANVRDWTVRETHDALKRGDKPTKISR